MADRQNLIKPKAFPSIGLGLEESAVPYSEIKLRDNKIEKV